jgi:hypothetical protein
VIAVITDWSGRFLNPKPHYALAYAGLAFEWLNKAYEVHDDYLPLLRVEPCLRSIRSDPRAADLLRRIGLPQ